MKIFAALLLVLAGLLTGCAEPNEAAKSDKPPTIDAEASEASEASDDDEPEAEIASEEPEAAVPVGKVGDTLEVTSDEGDGTIALTDVREIRPGQYDSKAENGRYVQVTLAIEATSGNFSINPFDFAIVDDEGYEYDQGFVTAAGQDLHHRDLHAGQKLKGVIVYDVPNRTALSLAYRGGGFGAEDVGIWELGK